MREILRVLAVTVKPFIFQIEMIFWMNVQCIPSSIQTQNVKPSK